MSASHQRVERVRQCLRNVLESLCPEDADLVFRRLNARFLSPASAFESGPEILRETGLRPEQALLLSMIPELARRLEVEAFGKDPRLNTLRLAGDYLKTRFIGLRVEHFYLLCLDASGRLLSSILLQRGTTDSTPFYVRHILQEAVRTHASALVISHNHPNNTLRPSEGDLRCTLDLLEALRALSIPLMDHIIIVNKRVVSLRQCGFVPENLWLAQSPQNALLSGWLSDCEEF